MSAEIKRRSAFPAAILYPMRIRDMTRFGFTEELFTGKEVPDE